MAIELTTATALTINGIKTALSAADSSVFLTQDNNSSINPRVVCNTALNQTKMVVPVSDTNSFYESSDYTSASWSNQGGAGAAVFVGSASWFNTFLDNTLGKYDEASLRVEYNNNGTLLTVNGWGFNGPDARVDTIEYPASPEVITSVTFYYTFLNRVVLDQDNGDYGIYSGSTIDIQSTSDVTIDAGDDLRLTSNDVLSLRNRGINDSVTIITNYNSNVNPERTWEFNSAGETELPGILKLKNDLNFSQSGTIGLSAGGSGDGNGYSTIEIVPDVSLKTNDQYVIVDPTAPSHIHIRAGGTQDASNAELILGGETAYAKIGAGSAPQVSLRSNDYLQVNVHNTSLATDYYWNLNGNGTVSLPTNGHVPSSSVGESSDEPGMIAIDGDYLYYCIGYHDGVSDIWKRVPFLSGSW